MSNDQKRVILSKVFIIPVGVAFMVSFFFLGYYVGKYQSKAGSPAETMRPLPEIAPSTEQKQDEFTFYKTLADKSDKTVSIDLKPKAAREDFKPENKQTIAVPVRSIPVSTAPLERHIEITPIQEAVPSGKTKQAAQKQPQHVAKKDPAAAAANTKTRYTVQTGSYPERQLAEDEVKRLKKRGYAAFIVSSELNGKGVWHRVRLGSFSNRAAAEKLQRTIHDKERITTIVIAE
jgi:DedD protein